MQNVESYNFDLIFKAYMKSYIPLKNGSHIFFLANLYLKQSFSSKYAMVEFICMGLLNLWWTRTENYKMKNSCPVGFELGTFRFQSERAKRLAIRADKYFFT